MSISVCVTSPSLKEAFSTCYWQVPLIQASGLQDAFRTQASPFLADVLSELEREITLELVMATDDDDVVAILDDEGDAESDELMLQLEEEEPMRFARILGDAMTITVAVKTIASAASTRVVCLCMCIFHMLELLHVLCNIEQAPACAGACLLYA